MSQRQPYFLGFLGSMTVATAWIVFMYATTFQVDAGTMWTASMFIIGGLALAKIFVGLKIEPFNFKRFFESILWTAISAGLIYIINKTVPFRMEGLLMSSRTFAVLMGVAEECTFRVFLCTFVFKVSNSFWLAVGGSSVIWTVYHFSRYGGSGLGAFLILFLAGLCLGAVMLHSRMADGVIFSHGLINFIALS